MRSRRYGRKFRRVSRFRSGRARKKVRGTFRGKVGRTTRRKALGHIGGINL